MVGKNQCQDIILSRLIERILSISRTFQHIEFFHILCEMNEKVDLAANKAIRLRNNELYVNLHPYIAIPP